MRAIDIKAKDVLKELDKTLVEVNKQNLNIKYLLTEAEKKVSKVKFDLLKNKYEKVLEENILILSRFGKYRRKIIKNFNLNNNSTNEG